MSGTYKAIGGETFSQVARVTTGSDTNGAAIRGANPAVREPIPAGAILLIPSTPKAPVASAGSGLSISVNSVPIGTFDNFALSMSIEATWKCGFSVPNDIVTRKLFVPLTSPRVIVQYNGELLFTGVADSPQPDNQVDRKTLEIECYADAGLLERVSPPLSKFPCEYTRSNLLAIVNDLCLPHGVTVDYRAEPGALFKRVDIRPGQTVLEFLSRLAAERGQLLSSSELGQLVVWTGSSPGAPVSRLEKGMSPCEGVSLVVNEENYYTSVTGTIPAKTKRAKPGVSHTVVNPLALSQIRPYFFEAPDIEPGELPTVVSAMAGRMFASVVTVTLNLSAWETDRGSVYRPNQTVVVTSPDDFIGRPYEFLIADVLLAKDAGQTLAALSLVLPGVYSGEMPKEMPWASL